MYHALLLWTYVITLCVTNSDGATQVVASVLATDARIPVSNLTAPSAPVNSSVVLDVPILLAALQRAGIPASSMSVDGTGKITVGWVNTTVTSRSCTPGYFSPAGVGTCRPCLPGTFSDGVQLGGCTRCPPGTYGPVSAGVGQAATCIPCPVSTFSRVDGAANLSTCVACPAGYSGPAGSDSDSGCTPPVDATYDQTLSTATVVGAVAGAGVATVMLGLAVGRPAYNMMAGGGVQSKLRNPEPSPLLAVKIDVWPLRWLGTHAYVHADMPGDRMKGT